MRKLIIVLIVPLLCGLCGCGKAIEKNTDDPWKKIVLSFMDSVEKKEPGGTWSRSPVVQSESESVEYKETSDTIKTKKMKKDGSEEIIETPKIVEIKTKKTTRHIHLVYTVETFDDNGFKRLAHFLWRLDEGATNPMPLGNIPHNKWETAKTPDGVDKYEEVKKDRSNLFELRENNK